MTTLARRVAVTTGSLVAGRIVAVLAGIVAVAAASRYLGTRDYGGLTTAMAFASSFAVLTDLGVSTVATREIAVAPERRRAILGNVVTLGLALGAVAALLALGATFLAYPGSRDGVIREAIAILLAQLLAAPFGGAARAHFAATGRGHVIAVGDVTFAVSLMGLTVLAVALDAGFLWVVAAVAAGYVLQAIALSIAAARDDGLAIAADWPTWKRLTRLALPLGGAFVINYLYFRLDILLLGWIKDEHEVGIYGLAYRVIEGLMVLPGYVMLGLFPEIARSQDNPGRLAAIMAPALAAMEAIALPVVVVTVVFADQIVHVIGGSDFGASAGILQLLILAVGLSYANGVYGNALTALGRQSQMFRITLVVLAVNLALNFALIPPLSAKGAAIAVVVAEVLGVILVRRLYHSVASAPKEPPHARIMLAALGLAPALLVRLAGGGLPDIVAIAIGSALAIAGYVALLFALRAVPEPILVLLGRSGAD